MTQITSDTAPSMRLVVMGVSGTGKSTVGAAIAQRLGMRFIEGDQYHSAGNLRKMAAGTPLTDDDRHDWLLTLQSHLRKARQADESVVLTCSALKRAYRDLLRAADPQVCFIHLTGSRDAIAARMHQRTGHFMPPALLDSQLRDLEPPGADEHAFSFDMEMPLEVLLEQISRSLRR